MKSTKHADLLKSTWLISLIMGVLGICIILFATTNHGIGVTPDTTLYFSVATNMANMMRYGGDAGTLIIAEPPLYPAVLAVLKLLTGAEPFIAARYLNATLFGLTIFLAGFLFKRFFPSTQLFFIVGTVSVLVSYSLVSVYLMAMTEPLFILFVLTFIIFLNLLLTKQHKSSLILLSLSAMLAFLTRYVGAILIFVGVICIFLFLKANIKEKFSRSFLFSFIAGMPTGVWVLRDFFSFQDRFSSSNQLPYTLLQNIGNALSNVLSWFLPYRLIHNKLFLFVFFFFVILIAGKLVLDILKKEKSSKQQILQFYGPLVILIFSYFAFLLVFIRYVVDIENRYVAPIFIPVTLLILAFVRAFAKLLKDRFGSKLGTSFKLLFCILWIIIPLNKTFHIIEEHYREGWGYSSLTWQNSKTIQYVVNNYQNCTFYSNRNDAIRYLTGLDTRLIPVKLSGEEVQKSLEEVWPPETETCLVIFKSVNRYYLYTEEELLSVSEIQETIHFDDGTIYILTGE